MIDATPSLEAAKGLTGPGLLDYLVANGWAARPSRVDGIAILSKDVPGADRPAEFILPAEPGWEDEQRRVADALRTIAAVERRSLADIADEVRSIMAPAGRAANRATLAGFAEDGETIAASEPGADIPSKD